MKTKPIFKVSTLFVTFVMAMLWTFFSATAQCPTVTNSTPPPICNASGYTFADLSADYATDNGNGIVWYNSLTSNDPYIDNELLSEGTYYADDSSGSCGARQPITISFQVSESGQNLDQIYCSNEGATIQTYINDVLQTNIPSGGGVEIYYDLDLTTLANVTDAIPSGATKYFIVFTDNGGCRSQVEIGQVGVFIAPADPTPANPQEFCSNTNPTIGDLDPGTTATNISWYNSVDAFGDPIPPALTLSTPLVDGNTYYVQINDVFCVSNPVAVNVNIDKPVDAGTSGNLEYCIDNLPTLDFNLYDELGGTPETTGSWSGPLTTSNGYQGTVNISSLAAGTHTFVYTVPSTGVCPDDTSNVVITVNETLSSGIPSTLNPASFCEASLPSAFNLLTLLDNEDAGGQWTQGTSSSDPVITSPIDLTGFTPGTYNFTYTQNVSPNPCPEESTTVQVIVLEEPNAGVAVNQTFCENDLVANSPFNLFDALNGSQDHDSGIWTDASNTTISNALDITTLTVSGSPYSYSYTIDNGTCSDTEEITITIEPAPESGEPVLVITEFCEGLAPASFNLFDLLTGEDQTGTWIDDDATGALTGNTVDLSGLAPNTYNFTYDVDTIGSCDDVNVTVSILINPLPNTGIPTSVTFCENDLVANSPLDLFGQLSGEDAGGTWSDDNATGALSGSDLDLTVLAVGSYNFTYSITDANSCTNSSTITVTIEDAPESGTPNTPIEFCKLDITTGQTYDLFDLLTDEDQSGIWNDDDASGALSGNIVTLDGLAEGTYNFTYDVDAIGSCDDVNVTVSIVINDTPAPGASTPQEFCDSATVADLVAIGNAVQWYDVATGGTPLTSTTALADAKTYYATQTNATTGCESSTRTAVLVTIYQSPNAGNPNTTSIVTCNTNNNIDLFTGLDGTQDNGGVWSNNDGVGNLTGNIFDATGVSAGTYSFTYTITASSPCVDDSETITVTIEEPLDAGTDGAPLDLCSNNGTIDLFTQLGGTPDSGGTWSPAMASGTGVFNPLVDAPGTYTYTLSNGCGTVSSSIDVAVTLAPNAGADATVDLCVIDEPIDLFEQLGSGAQSGGTWSPAMASGTGVFDPTADAAVVYTYTVAAVSPCSPDATATVTVTVSDTPTPTITDNNPEFCLIDNPTVSDLDSTISSSGTINWYEDASLTLPLTGTESLVDGEDYYATQTNSSGCESSNAVQINVTVNDTATPTLLDASAEYCVNDDPVILDLTNNIAEYDSNAENVVWYDSETGGSTISSSTNLTNTTYYAALIDASTGCESSTRLAVTPNITACGKLKLPDGFSPNGDGVNDTYEVDNLALLYPNFEIEIYNRNGNLVYRGNANTPRFDGTSNQSRIISKGDLPVGVYFYIFRFNDGENKPEQGRLYLSR
ncbi:gliding motility-associated C-terminal domain-containing protein [Seonamhaeicola sp.]|uniref:Ig-like domain-containing protein n=1 Tax=Seonamhaeicola sp. TaxID=1912245 RepID=UPI00356955DF